MQPTNDTDPYTGSTGATAAQPGLYQPPAPQMPVYPPPPEVYQQSGAASPWPGAPGAYPPPPMWYQPGQPQAAYPPYPPSPQYPPYPYPPQAGYPPYPPQAGYPPYPPQAGYPPYPYQPGQYQPYPPQAQWAQQGAQWPAQPQRRGFTMPPALSVILKLGSALVSFWLYAALWGWEFALGVMVMLFIHEMGHYVVIRSKGLPTGLPTFIPLLGAFVTLRQAPKNVRDEAEIGIAGPIAGALVGGAFVLAYAFTPQPVLLHLAYFSFYLNLLNLIPVAPLDGSRVTSAISKWLWPIGLAAMGLVAWYTQNFILGIFALMGLFQIAPRFRVNEKQPYYAISTTERFMVSLLYFGLIAALGVACYILALNGFTLGY